jgi:hypothetical protein
MSKHRPCDICVTVSFGTADADAQAFADWWGAECGNEAARNRGARARLLLGHSVLRHITASSDLEQHAAPSTDASIQRQRQDEAWARTIAAHEAELSCERARSQVLEQQLANATQRLVAAMEASAEDMRSQQARVDDALSIARARLECESANLHAAREAAMATLDGDRKRMQDALEEERARLHSHYAALTSRSADASEGQRALVTLMAQMDARDADMRAHITQLTSSTYNAEILRLREELSAAKSDNDRLMGCNHVKGVVGEARVMMALQRALPEWAFVDTSAKGAESDFHMVGAQGEVLAVEVKNKGIVTAGDVEKSLRDVRELHERIGSRLVGYLFVSLRSRNIPRKGALAMETAHGVPVLWFGMDGEGGVTATAARDEADMGRAAKLLIDVGRVCLGRGGGEEGQDAQKQNQDSAKTALLLQQMSALLQRLDSARRVVYNMQDAINTARRHAESVAKLVDAAFQEAETHVRAHALTPPTLNAADSTAGGSTTDACPLSTAGSSTTDACPLSTAGGSNTGQSTDTMWTCAHCSRAFKSSQALAGHSRACRRQRGQRGQRGPHGTAA